MTKSNRTGLQGSTVMDSIFMNGKTLTTYNAPVPLLFLGQNKHEIEWEALKNECIYAAPGYIYIVTVSKMYAFSYSSSSSCSSPVAPSLRCFHHSHFLSPPPTTSQRMLSIIVSFFQNCFWNMWKCYCWDFVGHAIQRSGLPLLGEMNQ